jgi:hypothetical protein
MTLQTILAMLDEVEHAAAGVADLRVLVDDSEMDTRCLTARDVRLAVEAWRRSEALRVRTRFSIFAPSLTAFGLTRMAQAFAGKAAEDRIHVSRDESAARAWLLRQRAATEP